MPRIQSFIIHLLWLFAVSMTAQEQTFHPKLNISFDKNNNSTSTYDEIMDFYKKLEKLSDLVHITKTGMTDSGHPLTVVVLAKKGHFTPEKSRKAGKSILFINNGIHPGEPDGIDASMIFARDIISSSDAARILDNTTIVIIPVYNIGGCLNRSSTSRANQLGPDAYGFRANAKNLDLNRDFIKCDSKNAESFNQIFNYWNPDLMVDTHTSNGADYQYTMTLIATQKDKLHPMLSKELTNNILPELYQNMKHKGWEMTPFVNTRGLPETGIYGFMDGPRYSSGYAALHHTISFMPETHMLKPYKDRVWSTHAFIHLCGQYMTKHGAKLASIRKNVKNAVKTQSTFPLSYVIDQTQVDSMLFKGYTASYKNSEVSGLQRLYYDKSKPWEKKIPYFNTFSPNISVQKPMAYLIPQAYDRIVYLMRLNGVNVQVLGSDTTMHIEQYRIENFETSKTAYEGHYNHSQTQVSVQKLAKKFYKGDYIIYVNQESNRYIVESLEPQGVDSWFNWNFFDGILAQKEYFSDYVFEDLAAEMLTKNPELRTKLLEKQKSDSKFASDARSQLEFVYKNSPYYEPTHMMYPVCRLLEK